MHRGHAILAALVAAAGLWAYLATHPVGGASGDGGEVRVWDVPLRQVERVAYRDGDTRVTLEPRWEDDGDSPYVWIEMEGPPSGRTAAPQDESRREAFKGSAAAVDLLRDLAALPAQRVLGRLQTLDGETFGLPAEDAFLELTRREGPALRLQLGRTTYGRSGRYALLGEAGRVYLLGTGNLRRIAAARGSLMDRDLLAFPLEEAVRVELIADGLTRTLHRLEVEGDAGQWGDRPDAADGLPAADTVMTVLGKLKALRYAGAETEADLPSMPALEVRLYSAGEEAAAGAPTAWIRLYAADGQMAPAVSSHTRHPVLLGAPLVQQVLEQARTLLRNT